jgi:hypothetical protein
VNKKHVKTLIPTFFLISIAHPIAINYSFCQLYKNFKQNKIGENTIRNQILPALIPATLAVAKALALGAAGYAGTKLAQKAFGDGIKKNKKNTKNPKTYGQGIKLIGKRD